METTKLIYFLRHGQSGANTGNVFQSPNDELTELGHRQIALLGARFATTPFDTLISSPFPRAYKTAQAIHETTGKEIEVNELFREYVPPTSLHDTSRDAEAGAAYTALRKAHIHDPEWHFEDEENYFDLHERAGSALGWLSARDEHTFVVVTHLGFLKAIIMHMLGQGEPNPEMYINMRFLLESMNTGVTICRYGTDKRKRTGWRLVTWNDYTHLPHELVGVPEEVGIM